MQNLKVKAFSENQWVFADDLVTESDSDVFSLHVARRGNVMIQLLTDAFVQQGEPFSMHVCGANGVTVTPYQLIAVHVGHNSAPNNEHGLTDSYEKVKDFVTHKAPFDVYDATAPLIDSIRRDQRLAIALRFTASADALPGTEHIEITLHVGDKTISVNLSLCIHKAIIPQLKDSKLTVVNWVAPTRIAQQFHIEPYSDAYWPLYEKLLSNLLDIRNNHLSIQTWWEEPVHEKIRNDKGEIIDFDLSRLERHLQLAEKAGMTKLYGEYIARFNIWDNKEIYLLWDWDKQCDVTSFDAYKQLKAYFKRVVEMVERNNWQDKYIQPLVDEPQIPNSEAYRILCGMVRQFYPGVTIHDPVETYKIPGSADIYCVKQAVYEKYIEEFRELQAAGVRMTYYTCGFPAGQMMNRVLDLPLFVGRLTFWMCHRYHFEGFLHWGYCCVCDFDETCTTMPGGNQNIVYGMDNEFWESVRSHNQRVGAEDWELLAVLAEKKPELVQEFLDRGCRTFSDYETDFKKVEKIRLDFLKAADEYF